MSSEKRKYELRARAERLAETRRRIVEAAASLHVEVGPARTTVTEVARRAGVRRDTVYNHFPREAELFAACGDYSLATNPPPDPSMTLAMDDPVERLHAALTAFYGWYRKTARGLENLQRDRRTIPALDAAMTTRIDEPVAALVDSLAAGFELRGTSRQGVRALLGLALDFWTWRRLTDEGLSDDHAAALMAEVVLGYAFPG